MNSSTPYRYQEVRRVTLVGVIVNLLLSFIKVLFGWLGHSSALFADGLHSLSDLITDFMVLFASKAGDQAPDEDHPYGHARIETIATVILALFLVAVGIGIVVDAALEVIHQDFGQMPKFIVLVVATISVLANEFLFRYTLITAKKINSDLLRANAWHNRADAFSSIVVLIGAGATMLGFHFMDAVAAAIVAILIIHMGAKMSWQSVLELVDTGINLEDQQAMMKVLKNTPGVVAVHQMRTRTMAGKIFIDVHLQVTATISVSEGHYIAEKAYRGLRHEFPNIKDITIHIDAEDDETSKPNVNLPSREELRIHLNRYCHDIPGWSELIDMKLDYLNGKLYILLVMPMAVVENNNPVNALSARYHQVLQQLPYIAKINICFQV